MEYIKEKIEEVFAVVEEEVHYGAKFWESSDTKNKHSPEEWIMYMEHYLNDCKRICSVRPAPEYIKEVTDQLRKVMALGVKCLVQHGCPRRGRVEGNKLSDL